MTVQDDSSFRPKVRLPSWTEYRGKYFQKRYLWPSICLSLLPFLLFRLVVFWEVTLPLDSQRFTIPFTRSQLLLHSYVGNGIEIFRVNRTGANGPIADESAVIRPDEDAWITHENFIKHTPASAKGTRHSKEPNNKESIRTSSRHSQAGVIQNFGLPEDNAMENQANTESRKNAGKGTKAAELASEDGARSQDQIRTEVAEEEMNNDGIDKIDKVNERVTSAKGKENVERKRVDEDRKARREKVTDEKVPSKEAKAKKEAKETRMLDAVQRAEKRERDDVERRAAEEQLEVDADRDRERKAAEEKEIQAKQKEEEQKRKAAEQEVEAKLKAEEERRAAEEREEHKRKLDEERKTANKREAEAKRKEEEERQVAAEREAEERKNEEERKRIADERETEEKRNEEEQKRIAKERANDEKKKSDGASSATGEGSAVQDTNTDEKTTESEQKAEENHAESLQSESADDSKSTDSRIQEEAQKLDEEKREESVSSKDATVLKDQLWRPGECDLHDGTWEYDPEGPLYTNATCPHIEGHQNCMANGRPDTGYLNWRWKPRDCDLPRFDAWAFLEAFRGKTIGFVGDSLARNQMQSLLCMLAQVEKPTLLRDYDHIVKWIYEPHQVTVVVVWSPYLLKHSEEELKGYEGLPSVLHLDVLEPRWTSWLPDLDLIVLSIGQWYFKSSLYIRGNEVVGCHYCPTLNNVTQIGFFDSYREALRRVLEKVASDMKGIVIMSTFAIQHFEHGPWEKGGDCRREKPLEVEELPLFAGMHDEMRAIVMSEFLRAVNDPSKQSPDLHFDFLDVTKVSLLRADGHPGPYRNPHPYGGGKEPSEWLVNDCLHWCLPGPVDTWNQLLVKIAHRYL